MWVQKTSIYAQMSTVGECTKYLAPLSLPFDVVCQVPASIAAFSVLTSIFPDGTGASGLCQQSSPSLGINLFITC